MKPRKIILLIACAALLGVCIMQGVLKNSGKTKTYSINEEPDKLVIKTPAETIVLEKAGTEWLVGEKKYTANQNSVENIISAVSSIRILDKVASASNENIISQYELNEGKATVVEISKDEKILRTITVGKDSTAGSQSYITVDGGKEIYLATGNLSGVLDTTVDYLRTRSVYLIDKNAIESVTINSVESDSFSITRTGFGENLVWSINQPDVVVKADAAAEWFNSLAAISTPQWHDDFDLTGKKICDVEIIAGDKIITLSLSESEDEENPVFFGTCSETPYQFELASYSMQKFEKTLQDLTE